MEKQNVYTVKKGLIYLMLSVYVFGLIKPVMPLVNDVLAHTFFKNSHMATIHYENGRYHMHLELQQEITKSENKQVPVFSINESLAIHIKSDDIKFEVYLQKITEINTPYIDTPIDLFISSPFLPPQC
jgi:hypothetical protein